MEELSRGLMRVSRDQDINVQESSAPGSRVKNKHLLILPDIEISWDVLF
jgi:hypothetical protein